MSKLCGPTSYFYSWFSVGVEIQNSLPQRPSPTYRQGVGLCWPSVWSGQPSGRNRWDLVHHSPVTDQTTQHNEDLCNIGHSKWVKPVINPSPRT
ncbi:hypothetical protein RRG08_034704 [Elysia crispata]|uniref:Uncharacterized protein n=1 Tax=Elysia crispata TaxID=231223 RepID=A0AAE0Z126_9GAST|nr:hypothetical protein RRG08_034704 [Elysia crispata]